MKAPTPPLAAGDPSLHVSPAGRLPERTLYALLGATIVLTVTSAAVRLAGRVWELEGLLEYVDVDAEGNLPTWFGSSLLLMAALLLVIIAFTPAASGPARKYWVVMSAVFVLLSVDEATRFHEGLGETLQRALDTGGALRFAWILPYGILGVILLAAMIPFLRGLPARTRTLFLIAGACYVLGAAGMNTVIGVVLDGDPPEGLVPALGHAEELLEMTGVSVFIFALLDHLRARSPSGALRRAG